MKLADTTLAQICSKTSELIYAGQYEAARDELGELWAGVGKRPQLNFAPKIRAEILLQCGTLSGWLGSVKHLDVQEKAKDLLTESLHIFQALNLMAKVSEAQYELGICYWRTGAYEEARVILDEAIKTLGEEDAELKAKILIRRTLIEVSCGRYYQAWEMLREAEPMFESSSDALKGRWHGQLGLVLKRLATAEGRTDFADRAIIEFTAAIYHYEQAKHERYCALNLNNLAMLLYRMERYAEAHEHLDRARSIFLNLADSGNIAQVDDTRTRILLAEERYAEALSLISNVIYTFEQGGEQALLADALILQATLQARVKDYQRSQSIFYRAINTAENAGALTSAGLAAVSLIEEHGAKRLSEAELYRIYRLADRLLAATQDAGDIARLRTCARIVIKKLFGPELDEYFTLPETVLNYEARFIEQALKEERGSVTHAAHRLGITHQRLGAILKTRHKNLLNKRKPQWLRKSIIRKGK